MFSNTTETIHWITDVVNDEKIHLIVSGSLRMTIIPLQMNIKQEAVFMYAQLFKGFLLVIKDTESTEDLKHMCNKHFNRKTADDELLMITDFSEK
jgi:hypothetical protein